MKTLFIDTTNGLVLGLANSEFEWIFFEKSEEKRPSEIIHQKIDIILRNFKINYHELQLVTVAGPGSYTGMRLSEGIAHIFQLAGIDVVSLFHFEVPRVVGIEKGYWITNGFKKQFFVYEWLGDEGRHYLIDVDQMIFNREIYSNMDLPLFNKVFSTNDLIEKNGEKILKFALSRKQFLNAYYFRTLDEEFKSIC